MKMLLKGLAVVMLGYGASVATVQAAENYPSELQASWLAAANDGNADAQYALGKSKCCGYSNVYNDSDAMTWFCKAAIQGHREAQFEMGRQLEAMTEQDQRTWAAMWNRESYAWYSLAATQGHAMAELNRRMLQNTFDAWQQGLADKRIDQVMATRCNYL